MEINDVGWHPVLLLGTIVRWIACGNYHFIDVKVIDNEGKKVCRFPEMFPGTVSYKLLSFCPVINVKHFIMK